MESSKRQASDILRRPGKFLLRVLTGFKRNQGLLLAGAVAYYTLLSVIPMLALILVGLSHFIEEQQLYNTILTNLKLVIPAHAERVASQVWGFLARRQLVGVVGILVMLFFSSMAFTMLENAMAVIFSHRVRKHRRHFLISAIIPYAYIFLLGIGLLLVTLVAGALGALADKHIIFFGFDLSLAAPSRIALYFSGMFGMLMMLTSLYLVMPVGRIAFGHHTLGNHPAYTCLVLFDYFPCQCHLWLAGDSGCCFAEYRDRGDHPAAGSPGHRRVRAQQERSVRGRIGFRYLINLQYTPGIAS
jgi:uncharacterized BrkB/YihY/UPF0761 family membrane protein